MADAKNKTAENAADDAKKQTRAKTARNPVDNSTEWAQTVLNQLVEAQKTWFEITTEQNNLLLETVQKVTEMRQTAPTNALSDWAKQGIEGFIEAQKRWSEIAGQQSEQILKAVQANQSVAENARAANQNSAQETAAQGHDALAKMQTAWLDFAAKQNEQMIGVMKETLRVSNDSPAAALADFAQQAVNNYVEVQKRWLNLAMQLPFLGANQRDEPPK